MTLDLKPISIKELTSLSSPKVWTFNCYIDQIKSITPIKGWLQAEKKDNYLIITANIKTKVDLTCHRCLKNFTKNLKAVEEELILISKNTKGSDPVTSQKVFDETEDWLESIHPNDSFDPQRWAFEQLSLQMPTVNICSQACPGFFRDSSKKTSNMNNETDHQTTTLDPRWSLLKKIQKT